MNIEIREVKTGSELKSFIRFPYMLYNGHSNWLPPLLSDEKKFHHPLKNKAYAVSDTARFLAYKDGKLAGRVMGVIHHPFNQKNSENTGRFFAFESMEDESVGKALLDTVENWCRQKGMDKLIGPFGFSDKDPQGFLVEGFEHRGILTAPYNPVYYPEFAEKAGFQKMVDLVEYMIPVPEAVPDFYQRIIPRILQNTSIRCVEFKKKKELKPYIVPVLRLVNETFTDIYGSVELSEEEMHKLAAEYMMVLDPEFIKVVEVNDEPVGFILGMPDIGPALQKARGRLLPFGVFHILREMKRTDYLVLFLGGIKKGFQGKGIDVLLGTKMLETAIRRGYKEINSHLELETNLKVRAEMERTGGQIYKRYRIYEKKLAD